MSASGKYSILLPCDTPFVLKEIMELLFELSPRVNAVIPRWPNGNLEPLQAVYETSSFLEAIKKTFEKGENRLLFAISLLKKVRYISTNVIKQIDTNLTSFFNTNSFLDLEKAKKIIIDKKRFLNK
jgi:molybdopterin-guanine dinucleotide biosynthesis protein A